MFKFKIYVGDSPDTKCTTFLGHVRAWTNDGAYKKALSKFGEKLTDHITCMVEMVPII